MAAATMAMAADRVLVRNDPNELIYVEVVVHDANGVLVPEARVSIAFEVIGCGTLLAVGTGDPTDVTSFQSSVWTTWRGRVVAIVQPSGVGTIVVQARGLEGVVEEVTIQVV